MRDDPKIDRSDIAACLDRSYGLRVSTLTFLPLGYDSDAWAYRAETGDGARFVKVRRGENADPALAVPAALAEAGVPNVLAPVRTRDGALTCQLDDERTVTLFPFVRGESAMVAGLTDDQWRTFGATLRAVHDSGLGNGFAGSIHVEDFLLPSAMALQRAREVADRDTFASPAARELAACYRACAGRIDAMLDRAEALGRALRSRPFELVLCHADIHAANILVGDVSRIWLADWDGPMLAPRERDLLFVVGSRIARHVEPREEALFFAGYGEVQIDPEALVYYRYERIVEDLGEFGKSVFLDASVSEGRRAEEARLALGLLAPGGDIDRAEAVARA